MKKIIAVFLAVFCVFSCTITGSAADEKTYKKYKNYVLLGDSAVSGYEDNGPGVGQFEREDFSFSAIVADTLGVENFFPGACPGFRTGDIRYILEDNYVEDEYLFYYIGNELGEKMKPIIRQAVIEADLITIGIGGNDFGAYITWVYYDIMEEDGHFDGVAEAIREYIGENGTEDMTLMKMVEIVENLGHIDRFLELLPTALMRSHQKYGENWDIMIQDIYDLNPDVDLLVLGMYNSAIKSEEDKVSSDVALKIQTAIADWANTPMIEGAEKFGYIFVNTQGTICDVTHPTREGQKFLAQRVLESLPDASFPYTDVAYGKSYYPAIKYIFDNDIMAGKSSTVFGVDDTVTKAELSAALNKIDSANDVNDSDSILTYSDFASSMLKAGIKKGGITTFFKSVSMFINILMSSKLKFSKQVIKSDVAVYLYEYAMM